MVIDPLLYSLIVSGLLYSHLSAKYLLVRVLRGSKHLSKNTRVHYLVWGGCVFTCIAVSFILAASIPFFGALVGFVGACFGSFIVLIIEGAMWFYDSWHLRLDPATNNLKFKMLVFLNTTMIIM